MIETQTAMLSRVLKQRIPWAVKNSRRGNEEVTPYYIKKGSDHYRARFTEEDIREIRLLLKKERATQSELAKRYGVSKGAISNIACKKTWKHVKA